ncbi:MULTISPECIES: tripartite tricarboxylate transporter TctB family protein [unclassified Curtobacterium]|uniref:tripartite tricarboxylate transporter TctB family protein n=1 Tax=unclassified Curtobacterium TaxID=257496 RepID=UPI000DAABD67|nr:MULTISPECIES: tripartite tricarboxylate transporter TctB family protein [unclassified Curtobacterium]UBQ01953.1 tripartite tricarboxylate transporter TctB family protein [Curtobacterium sp. TXMA1]WIE75088.1 tripartite tricarboxylate transporter TctB family protein [Curtobacterium sp. MCSS17_007]
MSRPSNPTSSSAVVGQRLTLRADPGRVAAVAKELTTPALFTAFAVYLVVGIVTMEVPAGTAFPGPAVFPGLVAAALLLLAALLVVRSVRTARGRRAAAVGALPEPGVDTVEAVHTVDGTGTGTGTETPRAVRVDWRSLAWVVLSFAGFALLLGVLGWIVGAGLLFLGVAKGLGAPGWLRPLVVGLTVSAISYIAFDMLLDLSLPSGIVGWEF